MIQLRRRTRLDILSLIEDPEIRERINQATFLYKLNKFFVNTIAEYKEQNHFYNRPFVVLTDQEGQLEGLKQNFPRASILFIGTSLSKVPVGVFQIMKLSMLTTSSLDFFIYFQAKGSFFSISTSDLFSGSKIPFDASIKLPLNQRFLPVLFRGLVLSEKKFQKIRERNKIYIRDRDAHLYHEYVCKFHDRMGVGVKKRTRSVAAVIRSRTCGLFSALSCENKSDEARSIYQELLKVNEEFSGYSASEVEVMTSLLLSEVEEFDFYFPVPWVSLLVGYLAVKLQLNQPERVMRACVLSHLGLLEMPALVWDAYQKKGLDELTSEQLEHFKKIYEKSKERAQVLDQSIEVQDWSLAAQVFERQDGLGFPQQLKGERVSLEAHLIRFCFILWQKFRDLHRSGQSVEVRFLLKEVLEEEKVIANRIKPELLALIEKNLTNI